MQVYIFYEKLLLVKHKLTECAKFLYIDPVNFPEQDIKPYQSAKEIIEMVYINYSPWKTAPSAQVQQKLQVQEIIS